MRALQQIPPALLSIPHPYLPPPWHRVSDSTRHTGLSQSPCLNYRCVPWQRALGSCSPCSPRAGIRHCPGGWRAGEAAANPSWVCSQHTHCSNAHTGLPYFALPSASTASSLLLPPRARFNSRQAEPPGPAPEIPFALGKQMPVKLWVPSSSGHPPKKTSREDFTCKLTLIVNSTLHFNQSQQAINTTHPWGFGSHYSLLGKKYYEKNQRGELIEPAAVCSTYEMSQSSCCCTGFFYKGWAGESSAKTRTECLLCSSMTVLYPTGHYVFCRTWHINTVDAPLEKFCNSVYYNENIFPFFNFFV